jgi:hypothetical protein
LGGHRLDLDDLVRASGRHELSDDSVRLVRVACPMHLPASRDHVRLEFLDKLRQPCHNMRLDLAARLAQLLPVAQFIHGLEPLGPNRGRDRATLTGRIL